MPEVPSIFAFEFTCACIPTDSQAHGDLFSEGFAMLHEFVGDLLEANIPVTVLLHEAYLRYRAWFEGCTVVSCDGVATFDREFTRCVVNTDATYLIAPESEEILLDLSRRVIEIGNRLLSPGIRAVETFTYKSATNNLLEKYGFKVPRWILVNSGTSQGVSEMANRISESLFFPLVVKPDDGAGSEETFLIPDKEDLMLYLEKTYLNQGTSDQASDLIPAPMVFQEFVEGQLLSASILLQNGSISWVAINAQETSLPAIREPCDSEYLGGRTPIDFTFPPRLITMLERVLGEVAIQYGYVGIDFILGTDGNVQILEINPRLTTSFVGLRAINRFNLGLAIISQNEGSNNFDPPDFENPVVFGKTKITAETFPPELEDLKFLRDQFPEILTPIRSQKIKGTQSFITRFHASQLEADAKLPAQFRRRLIEFFAKKGIVMKL